MLWLASVFLRPIARKEIVADEERAVNGSAYKAQEQEALHGQVSYPGPARALRTTTP